MASSVTETKPLALAALQQALASSVAGGTFADTAYHLYSRRQRNWKIGAPRALYGSSIVMKSVSEYLRTQLDRSIAASTLPDETDDYDYDSDSDLDDSEDERDVKDFDEQPSDATKTPGDLSPAFSDLDSMDFHSEPAPVPEHEPSKTAEVTPSVQYKYHVGIPDVAANTWQALIHFVYTGEIRFSPLKSEGLEARRTAKDNHCKQNPYLPPLCSPKSMYRLAKIVGLTSLQDMARDDLKARISSKSIAREVFSKFSSVHEEVLDMELEILYRNGMPAEVMAQVTKAIASICRGQKPYCERVLTTLLRKLSMLLAEPTPRPPSIPPYLAHMFSPPNDVIKTPQASLATHERNAKPPGEPITSVTSPNSVSLPAWTERAPHNSNDPDETVGDGFSAKLAKRLSKSTKGGRQ